MGAQACNVLVASDAQGGCWLRTYSVAALGLAVLGAARRIYCLHALLGVRPGQVGAQGGVAAAAPLLPRLCVRPQRLPAAWPLSGQWPQPGVWTGGSMQQPYTWYPGALGSTRPLMT
jgi:hypothetical protein